MFDIKSVPVPNYSRKEDMVNSITHAPGVLFAVIAFAMVLHKLGSGITGVQILAVVLSCFSMFVLYFGSALYHGLRPGFAKQLARVLDHSNIFMMIAGSLTALYLFGVYPVKRTLGITLTAVSWGIAAIGILFTFMDQEKFKKIQMALYLVLGWSAVSGISCVIKTGPAGKQFALLILLGGIVYSIGAIFYGVGKKIPYIHSVFHIFILAGTILQFCGIYLFL